MSNVVGLQHVSIPMPPGGNDVARDFFGVKLGLSEKAVPSTLDASLLVWFDLGGDEHELHVFTEDGSTRSVGAHVCIQVADIDVMRERLVAHGIEIEETIPVVNRPRFFLHDPFGNWIEITQVLGDYTGTPVEHPAQPVQGD